MSERIGISAAVRTGDGRVFVARTHCQAYLAAEEAGARDDQTWRSGFVTLIGDWLEYSDVVDSGVPYGSASEITGRA